MIDLSAIDANSLTLGNADFNFIGSAAFTISSASAGQLRLDALTHILSGDINGDAVADFEISLSNINAFPVQRNSGIDGFLKEHIDGNPIPVKIQTDYETLEDAIEKLEKATKGKEYPIKIVIQTKETGTTRLFDFQTDVVERFTFSIIAAYVILFFIDFKGVLLKIFTNKVMVYLGKVSYGIYLFHPLPLVNAFIHSV